MNNLKLYFNESEFKELIECTDLKVKCLKIIERLFKGVNDKSGEPYIGHLLRVSDGVNGLVASSSALLHDTIEDINGITFKDLEEVGIPNEVIDILMLVTRDKNEPYDVEISRIIDSGNIDAINLKISDMTDNSDEKRLEKLNEELKIKLKTKYTPQLERLKIARREYYDRH